MTIKKISRTKRTILHVRTHLKVSRQGEIIAFRSHASEPLKSYRIFMNECIRF